MIIFSRLGFMPHPFQLFFFQDLIITGVPSPVSCLHRLRALALFNGSCSLTDHDVSYSVLQFTFAVSVTPHKTNTSLFPMLLSSLILSFVPFKWYEDLISFLPFRGNFLLVLSFLSLSLSGMCLMVWRHAHSTDIDWNVWTTLDQVLGVLLLLCQQQRNHWPVRIFSGL